MNIGTQKIACAVFAGFVMSMASMSAAEALSSNFSFMIVETDDDGAEKLVKRETVKPGETIHYQLLHENMTEQALSGLVIAAPVPQGVSLTFGGQDTSVSAVFEVQAEMDPEIDGLEWSTLPALRKVADADGNLHEEPLPEEEVAAVRWTLSQPLEPGEIAKNSYRVRLN
ncbi:MAG TPA: hypothetical protein ENH56_17075 [Roseobacter sp.]|uniref:DUF11 domain-containing protein n=1 Tax=marine sediment metagenome TaxID=412755 RepID=A0A0F9T6N5_9ZZZZ|nr:hypothetical protein [Roseobacter sp.]|tara:strand:+ start:13372 stop:13881 length:510 start_codon:yes stop_codon:yes gene_type:complete